MMAREEEEEELNEENIRKALERVAKKSPEMLRQLSIQRKLQATEYNRIADKTGAEPVKFMPKIANAKHTLGKEEEELKQKIDALLEQAKHVSGREALGFVRQASETLVESVALERKLGTVHRQALERLEDRFHSRLAPLSEALRRLNDELSPLDKSG